ncbi:MAG: hypothetical protein M3021_12750 [Actinomycetota bacterium]|nr:hypothetical protein [Actinomycetota bacterium]
MNALDAVAARMGGRAFIAAERNTILAGKQFSMIGIPGGGAGGEWQSVTRDYAGDASDVRGFLQHTTASVHFGTAEVKPGRPPSPPPTTPTPTVLSSTAATRMPTQFWINQPAPDTKTN